MSRSGKEGEETQGCCKKLIGVADLETDLVRLGPPLVVNITVLKKQILLKDS